MISILIQWLGKLADNHPRVVLIPLILDILFFYGGFHLYAQASEVDVRVQAVEAVIEGNNKTHNIGIRSNGIAVREAVQSIKSYALEQQIITMETEASALERADRRGELLDDEGDRLDHLKARINQIHRDLEKVKTTQKNDKELGWVG